MKNQFGNPITKECKLMCELTMNHLQNVSIITSAILHDQSENALPVPVIF